MAKGRKQKYSVRQKFDKYKRDLNTGKRTKANSYRKGYMNAANDIANSYNITKK